MNAKNNMHFLSFFKIVENFSFFWGEWGGGGNELYSETGK